MADVPEYTTKKGKKKKISRSLAAFILLRTGGQGRPGLSVEDIKDLRKKGLVGPGYETTGSQKFNYATRNK